VPAAPVGKDGTTGKEPTIVASFVSATSTCFIAGKLCGFFSVKRKLFRSNQQYGVSLRNLHSTGVKSGAVPEWARGRRSGRTEAIAAAVPQQRKALPAEHSEERRTVRSPKPRAFGTKSDRPSTRTVRRDESRRFQSGRQTQNQAIPSDVAEQRTIIGAETKSPFEKRILVCDTKSVVE
jgi:hypothetical protein